MIVYSPMKSGLLSGKMTKGRDRRPAPDDFRRRASAFQEPQLIEESRTGGTPEQIGARHGRSAGEVAIAWTLHHPAVTGAIVGMRSPEQVAGVVGALEFRLAKMR